MDLVKQNIFCDRFISWSSSLSKTSLDSQRLRLDQTSKVDPVALLETISKNGISQDVCINDLGMGHNTLVFLFDSYMLRWKRDRLMR